MGKVDTQQAIHAYYFPNYSSDTVCLESPSGSLHVRFMHIQESKRGEACTGEVNSSKNHIGVLF